MSCDIVIQFSYTHTIHTSYTNFKIVRIYTRLLILNVVI